ncbi:iron-containing redox enzyme family protein [Methylococcus sp. EFPC2]|uniref:iron-containing redox enzyme family protein n=1 Tax=Methylococcus sp. EFPC2 TaxID=2812648 RepID=UPI0019688507|nr:iron-containing redox enzyme family protein [Methylococcus sp. EFPC2]QSA95615.1 iron-containing redox enzyme family protein [Methylococcus sp. EFPC2]
MSSGEPWGANGEAMRGRFHRWVHARECPGVLAETRDFLDRALAEVKEAGGAGLDPESLPSAAPSPNSEPAHFTGEALAFHAPLGLLEGGWLQSVALAGNGHLAEVAELFAAYLELLGPDEAAAPASYYRGALAGAGVSLPAVTTRPFAFDTRIGVPALEFSCLQLALGLHASCLLPEVIGYTLAYACSAAPWRLLAAPGARRSGILRALDEHARRALQMHAGRERVRSGVALYARAEARYFHAWSACESRSANPAHEVAEIFRRKAPYARGHHGGISLGGRSLDQWFADEPFDATPFLAELAASSWMDGPEGECPFDRLAGFGGPMFGVFSAPELALIAAWRKQAATRTPLLNDSGDNAGADLPAQIKTSAGPEPSHGQAFRARTFMERAQDRLRRCFSSREPPRSLFHRLLVGPDTEATVGQARLVVERVLRRSGRGGVFADYSPQALSDWVERQYAGQVAAERPFDGRPRLSRAGYVWGVCQFAPVVLVDGCWLQHQGEAAWQGDRVRRLLYRIYADELGAGRVERNHPNVYRALLASVGVDLPPFDSPEFARHDRLLDSAFDLPVYLLAISRFPHRYLPEVLGLNLAIELSGLGAQYRRLADELRHWGLDPAIVTLHQSIDTLAGGHAALAVEAIQCHLDEVARSAGAASVAQHWDRIGRGYRSLTSATRPFKWALVLAYARRFLPGRRDSSKMPSCRE